MTKHWEIRGGTAREGLLPYFRKAEHYVLPSHTLFAATQYTYSRGHVHSQSKDPLKEPTVDPHFLQYNFDVARRCQNQPVHPEGSRGRTFELNLFYWASNATCCRPR
ncbi:hypothetical protein JB92DRAFT_3002957 [Gautieria morchelliformis]|nr:hypothetical protein JB92DRAFT_3002957 [Gautieria morchelliformis]